MILASVVPVLQDVLSGSRKMELKPAEDRPPHYRQFRVDPTLPLTEPPTQKQVDDWQQIQKQYEAKHGQAELPLCEDELVRRPRPRSAAASTAMPRRATCT
jgi:hypothetical protein